MQALHWLCETQGPVVRERDSKTQPLLSFSWSNRAAGLGLVTMSHLPGAAVSSAHSLEALGPLRRRLLQISVGYKDVSGGAHEKGRAVRSGVQQPRAAAAHKQGGVVLLDNPVCVGARDTGVACSAEPPLGGALTSCSRRVASARSGPDASLTLLRRRPGVCTRIKPVSQSAGGRRRMAATCSLSRHERS